MKRAFFFPLSAVVTLLVMTGTSFAQGWFLQTSGTTQLLEAVSFVDSSIGTVVGHAGTILRTTNGGAVWFSQTSGTLKDLEGVSFVSPLVGFAVGETGTILRTTDGGTTWTPQTSGTTQKLEGVIFLNADVGTAVGGGGKILRTTNGGATWVSQSSGTTKHLHAVSFTDVNTGTVVGDGGTILRTTDGGATWTSQVSGTTKILRGVSFTDANNGTAVGTGGTILRTTNGGLTWVSQSSGITTSLLGVSFVDANVGTAVGANGVILRTTDGGATWVSQSSGTTNELRFVQFIDANIGTAVGANGTILRTTTGGGGGTFPGFSVSPTSIAFGNVVVGQSKQDSVTVTNTGTSTLTIGSVTSDNGEFSVTPTSGSIPPSGSQKFYITFSPADVGSETGNIVFVHDAAGSPDTVAVSGTGVAPGFLVSPTSIAFGNVVVGQSKQDSVTVTNTGTSTLTIGSVTSDNGEFSVTPTSGSIPPSGSQKFYITFSPADVGSETGNIVFVHDAAGSPDTVAVSGTGVAPGFSVSPTSIAFGNVVVGQSKQDSVTVTNTGTSTLTIGSVTSDNGEFSVTPTSGSIPPSGSQKFYITFSPADVGSETGNIVFVHDAAGSPDTVAVSGTGVAPGFSVSPTSIAFGNVVVGQSKQDSVTVTNTGTSTLTIGSVTSDNGEFSVTPTSGSIPPSGSQKFYITFSPADVGSETGNIVFVHDAAGSPDTVAVSGTGVAPGFSVSPTSIAFGNVVVGQSKQDSVTVTNTGTSTLTIGSVTSDNGEFSVTPTSGSIPPSGSQKFYITFSPADVGSETGNIVFVHDAAGSPDTVAVSGTGVAPGFSVSPTSIAFGNVVVGQSKQDSVTVTNTGTSTLTIGSVTSDNGEFSVTPTSGSIPPSGSQKFYITFSPADVGSETGNIVFVHDAAGSPDTVAVSGTGVAPGFSVSPTSIAFGNVVVGQSKQDSVTVTNTGTSTLTIGSVTSDNGEFSVTPTSGSIPPSGSQKFYITFSPADVGSETGNIVFVHDAAGSPDTVAVSGTGVAPGFSVSPTSIAFGNVVVGQSKQDSVTVTNTGTSTLTIGSVTSDNGEFSVTPTSGSIPPSGSQKFYITFSPADVGSETGNIVFVHDAAGSPDTVAVSGTGVAPGFSVSPTSIAFGNVVVGQSKQDSVTVTNTGTSTLTIGSVTSDNGEFSVTPTSGSIPPSGSQKFYITFSPADVGSETGNIVFVHDAAGSPDTVAVSGTGVAPGFSVSPTSIAFGNVVVGQSKQDSVTVTNTGTSTLTIGSVTSDNGEFSVTPTSGSIPPSGSQKFYITFSPADVGSETGNIVFVHDAAGSPDTVAVSGTGVAPGFSVSPTSIAFGNVVVGQSKQDSVTVTNTGTSTLTIGSVTSDNGEFSVTPTSGSIPPSGSQKFYITFSPADVGSETGNIVFVHDAAGSPDTVAVSGTGVAPGFSVSPTSIAFGNVVVGQSKQDSVTVTNTGTSTLTIGSVTSDNGEFSVTPTSGSIPPSGSQKFYITFSPADVGSETGNIVFVHDAAGSPDTVAVSGTGVAPGFSVSPTSIAFGNVVVGQSKQDSVTVTNTGTSTLTIGSVTSDNGEFSVTPTSGSIPPSGSQKFYITFSPADVGSETGNIVFVHDAAGSPDTVAVSGTGVAPGFSVSPTSIAFGNVVVGQSKQDSVTVTNTGTSTLTIGSVTSDNGEFSVTPTSGSIPPSGSQKFYITFSPADVGSETGNIVFVHDAAGSPDTVAVSGTGVAPGFSVSPTSIAFGNVVVGQSKQDSVTVTNTGTSTLTIGSVTSDNGEFSVTPTSGSIPPSGSQKFYITFSPADVGSETGNIVFVHDAAGSPDTVAVSGTGVAPGFSVSPTSIAFGNVVVGQSKQDSVTVTNTGTSTLTIGSVTSDNGEFSVTPTSGSIPPSGSQKFYITFSPADVGSETGNIVFVHDAAGSPDTVAVSGTGVAPGFSVSPTSIAFGNVVVGQSKQDSVTVTNTGTSTLTIGSVTSDNGEFSVTPTSGSIPPSGSQKFYITFSPADVGSETGNIVFVHDAAGSPNSVAVSGTGVAPGFLVTPTSIAFGDTTVGAGKVDSVTVSNPGTSTLTIFSIISDNPEFTVSPSSGSIAPSASQKFYITFTPADTGASSGYIVFVHDAASSPDTVSVSGNGLPIEIVATFLAGWEMISNPVTTSFDSVRQLFPTADFDFVYSFSNGGYELSYRIENRRGYWSRFSTPLSNMVTGIPRALDTFYVNAGWNLVGSISYPVDTSTIISIPPDLRTSDWTGYANGYVATDTIVPGKGYWVRANSAGQFILYRSTPRPTSTGGSPKAGSDPLAPLNTLTITDSKGGTQTLHFGVDAAGVIPLARYDMPPIPPLGSFDVRFETPEGGSRVRTHDANSAADIRFPIRIQAIQYPLTITWNISENTSYLLTDGSGSGAFQPLQMRDRGVITIDNPEVNRIIVQWSGMAGVPTEYALYQNYPNPFNPTTSIKFALPVESKVSADVYNILGQRVATLVNEVLPAGYHTMEWNGTGSAGQAVGSGVYFLRLHAKGANGKDFTDVKKLLLLK